MARVYTHMFTAVLISMIVSYFVCTSEYLIRFFFTGFIKWIIIFAPLFSLIGINYVLNNNPSKFVAQSLLYGFSALMGLSVSGIFNGYQIESIFTAFMGAAILFSTMSIYGYFTKQRLDSLGKFMVIGLISILIASIINIFIGSSLLQSVLSALSIIIFLGLTAYDTQRIQEMVSLDDNSGIIEVSGALTLYLNFINIILSLLQLFGYKKD